MENACKTAPAQTNQGAACSNPPRATPTLSPNAVNDHSTPKVSTGRNASERNTTSKPRPTANIHHTGSRNVRRSGSSTLASALPKCHAVSARNPTSAVAGSTRQNASVASEAST